MNRADAQRKIIKLYNTEYLAASGGLSNRSEIVGALPFYNWLTENYHEVLTFDYPGDRYQIVKIWVGLP